jgi:hypothetical protein
LCRFSVPLLLRPLDQAARDNAAGWLPPGIAYGDSALNGNSAPSEHNGAGRTDVGEIGEPDLAATDLPAFLTDDEPAAALNGATAS